jgi:UDP-N-acetylglucosamine--N-acetylmuramyl-(pentapeptide) pyrophosphoryl-undecaprenol N-acetylglucosamine transferase
VTKPGGGAAVTEPAGVAAGVAADAPRLWLATGGTGGHVFPALALAAKARDAGWSVAVLGGAGGPEAAWTRDAGFAFHGVAAGKLDRERPSPAALARALTGIAQAARLLQRSRPDLLVGFGGFASLPGVAGAWLTRTPYVLHETNAVPGLVTRAFARHARLVVLTQPVTGARLPRTRTAIVPLPVRERRVDRAQARAALGVPADATLTLVLGGSQGSAYLNETVPAIAERLQADHPGLWLLHQTGERWLDAVRAASGARPRTLLAGFVDAATAFSAADLAITRGGFGTLADAAFHGVPLVVVPLPSAAEDHQRHNAEALAADGAGLWAPQGDAEALERAWRTLLDPGPRSRAADAARARSPAGGGDQLLEALTPLARRRAPPGTGAPATPNPDPRSDPR